MTELIPAPVVIPLIAAAVALLAYRSQTAQRLISGLACAATLAVAVALLLAVDAEGVTAVQVGGWAAPAGITLVVDRFAAIMLVVSTAMVVAVLAYAVGQMSAEREAVTFHPVYLVLTAGVCLAFTTGDLFNLFVAFEVMLTASYVLLTLGATSEQIRSGMTYVVISLVASTLFVAAVALTYAATGAVNLADLAGAVSQLPDGVASALSVLLLVVFGVKAAIFPLFFWLPDAYPTAPSSVTALFAGLLTKVGVYAIVRTQTLLFPGDGGPSVLVLGVAGATMLVGVLGAVAQNDMKRILSFHIVSQIGFIIMGLGFFTVAGVAAAVFYTVHHIFVKTALFLVAGEVESSAGTAGLNQLGGLAHRRPGLATLYLLVGLSLAGMPPLSGFVAKLALVQSGLAVGQPTIVAVSLVVSLMTLFSVAKMWIAVFWGSVTDPLDRALRPVAGGSGERPPVGWGSGERAQNPSGSLGGIAVGMRAATVGVVATSLAVAVAAGPLTGLTQRTAESLLARDGYVSAVLGEPAADQLPANRPETGQGG
jgi:multicomponent Na+:H+ antiporter subunit D